jgi:hypothetical protein
MRPTTAAFRAAIAAQGVTVYAAGKVGNSPTYPYVVTFASTPTASDYSHAAKSGARRWRIATMYVGTSEDSTFWLAEKVEAALLDKRLTIAGLNCSPVRRESGAPIKPDPDVENVSTGTDVWIFTTTNA